MATPPPDLSGGSLEESIRRRLDGVVWVHTIGLKVPSAEAIEVRDGPGKVYKFRGKPPSPVISIEGFLHEDWGKTPPPGGFNAELQRRVRHLEDQLMRREAEVSALRTALRNEEHLR